MVTTLARAPAPATAAVDECPGPARAFGGSGGGLSFGG